MVRCVRPYIALLSTSMILQTREEPHYLVFAKIPNDGPKYVARVHVTPDPLMSAVAHLVRIYHSRIPYAVSAMPLPQFPTKLPRVPPNHTSAALRPVCPQGCALSWIWGTTVTVHLPRQDAIRAVPFTAGVDC